MFEAGRDSLHVQAHPYTLAVFARAGRSLRRCSPRRPSSLFFGQHTDKEPHDEEGRTEHCRHGTKTWVDLLLVGTSDL